MARFYAKIGPWIAELLLVFIGVYAGLLVKQFSSSIARRRSGAIVSWLRSSDSWKLGLRVTKRRTLGRSAK
jgi:hypothetical protein